MSIPVLGCYIDIFWREENKTFRGRMMMDLGEGEWLVWYPCDKTFEVEIYNKRTWSVSKNQEDDIPPPSEAEVAAALKKKHAGPHVQHKGPLVQTPDLVPEESAPRKRGRPSKKSPPGPANKKSKVDIPTKSAPPPAPIPDPVSVPAPPAPQASKKRERAEPESLEKRKKVKLPEDQLLEPGQDNTLESPEDETMIDIDIPSQSLTPTPPAATIQDQKVLDKNQTKPKRGRPALKHRILQIEETAPLIKIGECEKTFVAPVISKDTTIDELGLMLKAEVSQEYVKFCIFVYLS